MEDNNKDKKPTLREELEDIVRDALDTIRPFIWIALFLGSMAVLKFLFPSVFPY